MSLLLIICLAAMTLSAGVVVRGWDSTQPTKDALSFDQALSIAQDVNADPETRELALERVVDGVGIGVAVLRESNSSYRDRWLEIIKNKMEGE